MDDKDKNNLRGLIKKCVNELSIVIDDSGQIDVELENNSLNDLQNFIAKKLHRDEDIYNEGDIERIFRIIVIIRTFGISSEINTAKYIASLKEDKAKPECKIEFDKYAEEVMAEYGINMDKHEFSIGDSFNINELDTNIINEKGLDYVIRNISDDIIFELENPSISYAFIKLQGVEIKKDIKIADNLFLIRNIEQHCVVHGKSKLENEYTYMLIIHKGILLPSKNYRESLVYRKIIVTLKTFLGLSLVTDLLKISKESELGSQGSPPNNTPVMLFYQHLRSSISRSIWNYMLPEEIIQWVLENQPSSEELFKNKEMSSPLTPLYEFTLSNEYARLLNSLFLSNKPNLQHFLIEGKSRKPLPKFKKQETTWNFFTKRLQVISKIFNSTDKYIERIKAASLWYLEGYCNENDSLKFVNYCIAIESLLGSADAKEVPLTETLSNRYGFWLGKTIKEKEDIRKFFKLAYATRSRIVHQGKSLLNGPDYITLNKLEKLTRQIINEAIMTY